MGVLSWKSLAFTSCQVLLNVFCATIRTLHLILEHNIHYVEHLSELNFLLAIMPMHWSLTFYKSPTYLWMAWWPESKIIYWLANTYAAIYWDVTFRIKNTHAKGTVHQYQSHAIMHYFKACEIIIKQSSTRICWIYNNQWQKNSMKWNLNVLVSIVRARK